MSSITIVSVFFAIVFSCVSILYLQWEFLKASDSVQAKFKSLLPKSDKRKIYYLTMVFASIAIALMFSIYYKQTSIPFILKRIALFSILWPAALIDYQFHKIPNCLLIIGLILRGIILGIELVFTRENLLNVVLGELVASIGIGVFFLLLLLIMKNSIGMGDIKLFMLMGLFQGTYSLFSSLLVSFIISFLISLGLLFTKKKNRKDVIPFAPAILVGTFISFIITGA